MHTHFASGTHAVAVFVPVVIVGGFWRLAWLHVARVTKPGSFMHAMAGAALFQY
jgi:hypothetical protein